MSSIIVIPARIDSVRLPSKMLADIDGKPMIVHVFERVSRSQVPVLVATDSEAIADVIRSVGGDVVMTDSNLQSGTDRVGAALKSIDSKHEYVVNVQGDQPNIDHEIILSTLDTLKKVPDCDIATPVALVSKEDIDKPNHVKAVLSPYRENIFRALYFTRSLAPYDAPQYYYHIGVYAYKSDALGKFLSLKPSYLESCEKLEQLRALENNMSIYAVLVNNIPISVDVAEDLERARKFFTR